MSEVFLFGDSILWGSWDTVRGGWAQQLKTEVDSIQLARPEVWCPVYNLGIPGDTAAGIAKRIEREISARHETESGVFVVVAVGINDSLVSLPDGVGRVAPEQFTDSRLSILNVAIGFNATIGFVGLAPIDESLLNPLPWNPALAYTFKRAQLFNSAIAEFCSEREVPFVDIWSSWTALDWRSLLHDGLHPNADGHRLIYQQVRALVLEQFGACPT